MIKIAFKTRDFCINLGSKLVKIRLRFSRTVAVFSVSVTLVCRNLPFFYNCIAKPTSNDMSGFFRDVSAPVLIESMVNRNNSKNIFFLTHSMQHWFGFLNFVE